MTSVGSGASGASVGSGVSVGSGAFGAIRSVLVANRGEIVVRVCRTLRSLGIRSVAIYAPDDADAPHTRAADLAVPVDSYLDARSIAAAARSAGADSVHPGYGFLSEDPNFARAVVGAGLLWIGPPADAIETMGDKIRAKETVARAGVPVVPGAGRAGMEDEELMAAALAVGLPVLLKPAAGGGGKGMRRVAAEEDLLTSIAAARREAQGAFGDGTLLVERWVDRPRHVEVQVFADSFGNVVSLGERECSLQRRHQKIVEESPSPLLDDATRSAMSQSAVDAARSCGYLGAGTVEFIVSGERPGEYFFMEMNTRLQVEHPVTEAVTGVDLVEWQLRVAAGEPIPLSQSQLSRRGHAVEARVYAEDPLRGFLPASGTVALLTEPTDHPHVRVDSGLAVGAVVGTRYDPMLAKVIAWGPTRREAIDTLRGALEETAVLGVTTNIGYLARLLAHPDVVAGQLDTGLVDRTLAEIGPPPTDSSGDAAVVAACRVAAGLEPAVGEPSGAGASVGFVDPWEVPDGWTVGGPRAWTVSLRHGGVPLVVEVRGRVRDGAEMRVDGGSALEVKVAAGGRRGPDLAHLSDLRVTIDGRVSAWKTAVVPDDVWVSRLGDTWRFTVDRGGGGEREAVVGAAGPVTSPMPGVVVAVHVAIGDKVRAGQQLLAVEAMKMEHAVVAPVTGIVTELAVREGQSIGLDELLARVDPEAGGEEEEGAAVAGSLAGGVAGGAAGGVAGGLAGGAAGGRDTGSVA